MKLTYTHARYPNMDSNPIERTTAFDVDTMIEFVDAGQNPPTQKQIITWICVNSGKKVDHGFGCGLMESTEFHEYVDGMEDVSERVKSLKKSARVANPNKSGSRTNGGITNSIKTEIGNRVVDIVSAIVDGTPETHVFDADYVENVITELVMARDLELELTQPKERIATAAQKAAATDDALAATVKKLGENGMNADSISEIVNSTRIVLTVDQINEIIS